MIDPSFAHYEAAPETLVGTAWVYVSVRSLTVTRVDAHYVEAVAVLGGRVLVVAAHDVVRPLRTWWVPTENLLAETTSSAFRLIGRASDFAWVRGFSR